MNSIELKKYDDKYLSGIIACLRRNYSRFENMTELDVYKFLKPLITYNFSTEYSHKKGDYGYVLLDKDKVVGFFGMIYYRMKNHNGKFYTVVNPTTWAIDDKYRIYIFQATEALYNETDIVIDATPSYKELTIEKKMFGFENLSLKKLRFFDIKKTDKKNCDINKILSSCDIKDTELAKRYLDNVGYEVKCIEITDEIGKKCYVMYHVVFAKKHLDVGGDIIRLARILSVSSISIFNNLFFEIISYINENVEAVECDSMFVIDNEIFEYEHEEKQYTRIIRYNKECDVTNWDLLYTEIALRNEY